MLIILLVYSLIQSGLGGAEPIPGSFERRDVASCSNQDKQRALYDILWSCLSTIFLCTWVSVHPNIAFSPEKRKIGWFEQWIGNPFSSFLSYKLPMFLWALLVPEYILAWAVRQYLRAGQIQKQGEYAICPIGNCLRIVVPGWTRTHGFFVIMGGFHLFQLPAGASFITLHLKDSSPSTFVLPSGHHSRDDEVPICPLQMVDLPVDILSMIAPTETELKDKGKSDRLTKFVVLVQTLWFAIQCIARGIQHLSLTKLEVVTLAYATLNLFIYLFWWDKPCNVECPVRIYKTSEASHMKSQDVLKWKDHLLPRPLAWIFEYIIGGQDDFVDFSKNPFLPMFWSGRLEEGLLFEASMGPSILGAIFGAIHFIAWSYEFPTRAELVLWRISCVTMVAVPLVTAILCVTGRISHSIGRRNPVWLTAVTYFSYFSLAVSAWLYIASRITTLVMAFTTLRALSFTTFDTIDWTRFIPHI